MGADQTFLDRLRNAGISPGDDEDLRLQNSLLFFATGLISLASMVWLLIYWQLGPRFSSNLPFAGQLLLVGNLLVYLKTLNFNAFRVLQLSLFLFTPFVAQWSIGSLITASGISIWALLAPIGAVLFIGPRQSGAWFFAYIFLTTLSGVFDFYLADSLPLSRDKVSPQTAAFFFALNFAAVSTIVYLLLRYSDTEKHQAQARLQEAHRLLQVEQERSERLLLNVLPGPMAERLKNSSQTIAEGFAEVSVPAAATIRDQHIPIISMNADRGKGDYGDAALSIGSDDDTPQDVSAFLRRALHCHQIIFIPEVDYPLHEVYQQVFTHDSVTVIQQFDVVGKKSVEDQELYLLLRRLRDFFARSTQVSTTPVVINAHQKWGNKIVEFLDKNVNDATIVAPIMALDVAVANKIGGNYNQLLVVSRPNDAVSRISSAVRFTDGLDVIGCGVGGLYVEGSLPHLITQ